MRTKPLDILRHPILQEATNVCHAIEKCGASDLLTEAVTKAGALVNSIDELLDELDTKGGRVQAQVSGMPPDTEQILTDIFNHVEKQSNLEHEQSPLYKEFIEREIEDPSGWLLLKWNRDVLCAVHYMEKEKHKKFSMKQIHDLLGKAVEYVKRDYDDFIRRHSR